MPRLDERHHRQLRHLYRRRCVLRLHWFDEDWCLSQSWKSHHGDGRFLRRAQRWNPACATQVSECIPDGEPVEEFHQYQGWPPWLARWKWCASMSWTTHCPWMCITWMAWRWATVWKVSLLVYTSCAKAARAPRWWSNRIGNPHNNNRQDSITAGLCRLRCFTAHHKNFHSFEGMSFFDRGCPLSKFFYRREVLRGWLIHTMRHF